MKTSLCALRRRARLFFFPGAPIALAAAALIGCGSAAHPEPRRSDRAAPASPARPPTEAQAAPREEPPPSAASRPFRFPTPAWAELPSGLKVATLVHRALPVVEIRVLVPGGAAVDAERYGVAEVTGALLREGGAGALSGRDFLARLEAMGATLSVETTLDATVIRLAAPRAELAAALGLLGTMVQRPRLDAAELGKIKRRLTERIQDRAREDGRWAALAMFHREIYFLQTELHPYASLAPTPAEIAAITAADCRAFHARQFVPAGMVVVVAGDTTPEAVRAAAEQAFAAANVDAGRGGGRRAAPTTTLSDALPPESMKITLVDRPGSPRSDVLVGFLGPSRNDREWPAFTLAAQVLGGGAAGRLFVDLVAQQGIAHAASAAPLEVVQGPVPLVAHVATTPAKTGLAVQALLDHTLRLASTASEPEEVDVASAQLTRGLAVRLQTPAALADELTRLRLLGLPDDHHETYRREVRDLSAIYVGKVASAYVRPAHAVVVVAADADVVGPLLSHFGPVKIVDPTRNFERKRSLNADAAAPIEPPRAPGGR